MRPSSFLLFLALLCAVLASRPHAVNAQEQGTVLSGGDLPHPVRLAPADELAFAGRTTVPPVLDNRPAVSGTAYSVRSNYWPDAVPIDRDEGQGPAEDVALYYPQGGYARARQDGEDVWMVLDLRQRAVLDRYARLTASGALTETPTSVDVLLGASADEVISVHVGARQLEGAELTAFWSALSLAERVTTPAPPSADASSVWVIFGLPEGRTLPFLYTPTSRTLVDSLGEEVYGVPADWLAPVLGDEAPRPGQESNLALQIEQQEATGSPLFWLLVPLGILMIAAAAWLRGRIRAR